MPNPSNFMPSAVNAAAGGHGQFQLIVTVHEIKDLKVIGRVFSSPDTYVTLECGSNPIKSTCVKKTHKFNEQFKLNVRPGDKAVMCRIMDQDFFGSTEIAHVNVKVMEHILDNPERKKETDFQVSPGEGTKLRSSKAKLVLSFFVQGKDQEGYDGEANQAGQYGATQNTAPVYGK